MLIWDSEIIYTTDKKGSQRQWKVEVHSREDHFVVRRIFGQVDGKLQVTEKVVKQGKNIGRANETTPQEQAVSEAKSLYTKQTPDDTILPMLATTWTTKTKLSKWVYFQPKLDGVRVMVGRRDGDIVVMTRTGKAVVGFQQLMDDPAIHTIKEGEWVDGEAYSTTLSFEEISGKFRKQCACPELEFHVFDTFDVNNIHLTFEQRVDKIKKWKHHVPTILTDSCKLDELHDKYVKDGYEGIIIREPDAPYEIGYRSRNLLKFKKFDTNEFKIVGCEEGTAKDTGTGIFVCECENGTFNVRPTGTLATRKEYWENRSSYMNKLLTVKHQSVSSTDGIPRFPVGLTVRNYE